MVGAMSVLTLSSVPSVAREVAEVKLNAEWARRTFSQDQGSRLPFSFVYGGKPSGEIVTRWERVVTDKRMSSSVRRRTLTLTDPSTGLEVRAVATVYTDTPGVDWTIYFTNNGSSDTPVIEQVRAVDVTIEAASPVLHGIHGCYPNNWLPFEKRIADGESFAFGAVGGMSSQTHSPFFNIGFDGGGLIGAVGWSGQWTGSIDRANDGKTLRLQAGMEFMHLKLQPGETVRTPRILLLHYKGDEARSYNLFRHTVFAHITPRVKGKPAVPPIVHLGTSFDELNLSDEASFMSHLESVKGLGFEYFWMDAYFTRGGFGGGMGNYGVPPETIIPDPVRFPNGLKPLADAVVKEGLKFLVWFEPERVVPGTYLNREHPEYGIELPGGGSHLLDLGKPEARDYMTKTLDACVKDYHLSCMRFDYNFGEVLSYWQSINAKDPDRVGISEIRYVEGLYQMWDDLLKQNPGLFIDNCAGGGRRIDLETCSRSIALWRTDNTIGPLFNSDFAESARLNQIMTGGLSRYVPFTTSGQMGPHPYEFRSGVNGGGISFCEDIRPLGSVGREFGRKAREKQNIPQQKDLYGPKGFPVEELKQAIAEAKRIRKYYFGDYYALVPVTSDPADWCVFQYDLPNKGEGMIMAFRRPESSEASKRCNLQGIDSKANYDVRKSYAYERSPAVQMTGQDLSHLLIEITDKPGSVVIEYKKRARRQP